MENSVFMDKSIIPDQHMLEENLGVTSDLWKKIKTHLEENYGPITEDWKFYSEKYGWTLKMLRKKRNLFFFTPLENYFRIVFVFGDKAVAVIEQSDLPKDMIETLKNVRKYAEGRGLPIEVKSDADVENIKKLVKIKINN
jgi:hypothetical protein